MSIINSLPLQMKETLFYKREIQQKITEMLGMAVGSIQFPQEITFADPKVSYEDQGQLKQDEEELYFYDEQIEYYIIEPLLLANSEKQRKISQQMNGWLKKTVIKNKEEILQNVTIKDIFLYFDMSKESATITIYRFYFEIINDVVHLIPFTGKMRQILENKINILINQAIQIQKFIQFQAISIQSILLYEGQIYAKYQLQKNIIQVIFKEKQLQTDNYQGSTVEMIIKNRILYIIRNKLVQKHKIEKLQIYYSVNSHNQIKFIQKKLFSLTNTQQLFLKLDCRQKIIFLFQMYSFFGVTPNFKRATVYLKKTLFSAAKEKTYAYCICQIISFALEHHFQQIELHRIKDQVIKIVQQSANSEIINIFQKIYIKINEKEQQNFNYQMIKSDTQPLEGYFKGEYQE